MELECDTQNCEFEAKGNFYYSGFDDSTQSEIKTTFFHWLETKYPDLEVNESDDDMSSVDQSNDATVTVDDGLNGTQTGLIVGGTLIVLCGVGLVFFLRRRGKQQGRYSERKYVEYDEDEGDENYFVLNSYETTLLPQNSSRSDYAGSLDENENGSLDFDDLSDEYDQAHELLSLQVSMDDSVSLDSVMSHAMFQEI